MVTKVAAVLVIAFLIVALVAYLGPTITTFGPVVPQ